MLPVLNEMIKLKNTIVKISVSSPIGDREYFKILLKPIKAKGSDCWQAERFKDTKVYHLNINVDDFPDWFMENVAEKYSQICLFTTGKTITYFAPTKGKHRRTESNNNLTAKNIPTGNNREKNYILSEGADIPALVDLGVFTKENKIINSKYDKFKQINRFVEIINDVYEKSDKKEISILDFGCGKSYLTFIVYYYFVKMRGIKAKITGFDLKEDVVANCNDIAKRYGYDDLHFYVNDVTKGKLPEDKIDMVISLHACDVATDYALHFAITHGVKNIFSVPCCQHEVNLSIQTGGDFDLLLRYGLIKERFSALLTDAARGALLEACGYTVDMVEFVDLEHSPKNLMIRARKISSKCSKKDIASIGELLAKYSAEQSLYKLLMTK